MCASNSEYVMHVHMNLTMVFHGFIEIPFSLTRFWIRNGIKSWKNLLTALTHFSFLYNPNSVTTMMMLKYDTILDGIEERDFKKGCMEGTIWKKGLMASVPKRLSFFDDPHKIRIIASSHISNKCEWIRGWPFLCSTAFSVRISTFSIPQTT